MKKKKQETFRKDQQDIDYDPIEDRRQYGEDPYVNEVFAGEVEKDDK